MTKSHLALVAPEAVIELKPPNGHSDENAEVLMALQR
jgi:hypothetical protein